MESGSHAEEPKTLSPEVGRELARKLQEAGVREKPRPPLDTAQRLSPEDSEKAWRIAQEVMRKNAEAKARAEREAMSPEPHDPTQEVRAFKLSDIMRALEEKDRTERAGRIGAARNLLDEIYGS
ncbi:MAG: hypothetical protein AAB608_02020 [Patescibacteria group bacterium]